MPLRPLVVTLVLGAAAVCGLATILPPSPVPATAPPSEFSAERAMVHVASLAVTPRQTGTAGADAARLYLVRYLEGLGLAVHVDETTSVTERSARRWGAPVVAARVRNVVARRPGAEPGPALLLMAHYDSRELAPGASDDGYGCATLLETARALAASPTLRHDVLLLLTEGEEAGLLGARAFVAESPAARDVALVLNFDARGDRGAVTMFQTSPGAAGLVDVVAGAVAHVSASSGSQEVYRRMPNDTDLTPWLEAGTPGLNFANIDGVERYHQPTDTAENASLRTLQHFGDYALALARAFGDRRDLVPASKGDAVYFRAGPLFVRYAARVATPVAALATALLTIAVGAAVRRKHVRMSSVLAGMGVGWLAVVVAALLAWAIGKAADWACGGALAMQTVCDVVRKTFLAGSLLLGAGAASAVLAGALRRAQVGRSPEGNGRNAEVGRSPEGNGRNAEVGRSPEGNGGNDEVGRSAAIAMGAMAGWAPLAIAVAVAFPGGSYIFAWPLVASALAWCAWVARPSLGVGWAAIGLHLPATIAAALLALPAALQLGLAFGPPAGPLLAVVSALSATTAIPLLAMPGRGRGWIAPALLAAGAAGCVGVACTLPPFDVSSPRPDSLLYAVDPAGRAFWFSFDAAPDAWTARALSGGSRASLAALFPRAEGTVLQAPAPRVALNGPKVEVTADTREGDRRTLRLHVTLPPGTEIAAFEAPPAAHIVTSRVQGRPFGVEPADGWLDLAFFGPPAEGLELELVAEAGAHIALSAVAETRGLPPELLAPLGPRPPDRMPEVGRWIRVRASDMTFAAASFDL
jgi:hypothetical protein